MNKKTKTKQIKKKKVNSNNAMFNKIFFFYEKLSG